MASYLIKFTDQNKVFFTGHETLFAKQAVITTTMTKHIYNVFNLSFTFYKKKTRKKCIDLSFFHPKNIEMLVLCVFLANGAVNRVTPVSHILSWQNICGAFFPRTLMD